MSFWARLRHLLWLVVILLAACGTREALPSRALPGANAIPGWAPSGEVQVFDAENLYSLVNGQADAFFAYAFEQVAVRTYEDESGANLRIEIWQLGGPADAYGLLTTVRGGEPVSVGNGGDGDAGRRLDFWQDRYFARLFAVSPVGEEVLQGFAEEIAGSLPSGGELPALVSGLPREGLVEGSDLFFHQEISIQDVLWLGGENLLALGTETDGVLARYEVPEGEAWLMLIQYADNEAALTALDALRASGLAGFVVAGTEQDLFAAVFGPVTVAGAQALLTGALEVE
jgi:hypothetical protein